MKSNLIISVFSPTGGSGVTTIASQLAFTMATQGSTAIVELSGDTGNLVDYMSYEPPPVDNWMQYFQSSAAQNADSPYVFPGRKSLAVIPELGCSNPDVNKLFDAMRSSFQYSVLDLPHSRLWPTVTPALNASDIILLVGEYSFQSILQLSKFTSLDDFKNKDWSRKTKLLVNKVEWLPKDILDACHQNLSLPVTAEVPFLKASEASPKLKRNSPKLEKGIKPIVNLLEGK